MSKTMNLLRTATVLFALASSVTAHASQALANKYACVACHQAERKVVGPSWREIGARYSQEGASAEQLAASIKRGGSGKWEPIPMPPQPSLTDADARELAACLLGQRDAKP